MTPRTGTPSSPFPESVFQQTEQPLRRSTATAEWRFERTTTLYMWVGILGLVIGCVLFG